MTGQLFCQNKFCKGYTMQDYVQYLRYKICCKLYVLMLPYLLRSPTREAIGPHGHHSSHYHQRPSWLLMEESGDDSN